MIVISQQTAVQLSPVDVFEAPDPWRGMHPAQWTLSVYRIVPGNARGVFAKYAAEKQREKTDGHHLDEDDTLGIRSGPQAPYHLLPRAMVRLWQEGSVPTEALPGLIAQMEPKLRQNGYAYFSPVAGRRWTKVFGWVCLLAGMVSVLAGLVNGYVRHVEDSGEVGGLILLGVVFLLCGLPFVLMVLLRGKLRSRRTERQILALLGTPPPG